MTSRAAKLNALRQIAMTAGEPGLVPVLAFLAGRLDHVHFVEDVGQADVSIHISLNQRLWPRLPFRAQVDGAAIHNPIMFIDIVALKNVDVYVRVDLGMNEPPQWYTDVLESFVPDHRSALEASIEQIREKIDLALDAYRTASEGLDSADEEERTYLKFVLEKAKEDMRQLNAQLAELESKIGKGGTGE